MAPRSPSVAQEAATPVPATSLGSDRDPFGESHHPPGGAPLLSHHRPEFRLLGWPGLSVRPSRRELGAACAGTLAERRAVRALSPGSLSAPPSCVPPLQGPSPSPCPRLETDPAPRAVRGWDRSCDALGAGDPGALRGARPPRTDASSAPPAGRSRVQGAKRRPINFSTQKSMLLSGRRSMPARPGLALLGRRAGAGRPGSGAEDGWRGAAHWAPQAAPAPTRPRPSSRLCSRASGATLWPLLEVGVSVPRSRFSNSSRDTFLLCVFGAFLPQVPSLVFRGPLPVSS